MNAVLTNLSENLLQPAAWALVHFLWQGALVALAVGLALFALRRGSSRTRYAAALAGMIAMAILPAATAFYLASPEIPAALSSAAPGSPAIEGATPVTAVAFPAAATLSPAFTARLEPVLPWLLAAWLLGVAFLSLAQLGGWRRVRRLRRETRPADERWRSALGRLSQRLGVRRSVELLEAAQLQVPVVVGWLRPAILVPASAFAGLSPRQLEAILAHELAHIRRHDYLVNLFQLVVETLLFYHPGVWWVSRQVRVERENCCDDLAVGFSGNPVAYARALTNLEGLRLRRPALALGADGGSLLVRVRRLVGREEPDSRGWLQALVAALVATLVAAFGAALLFYASSSSALPIADGEDENAWAQEESARVEEESARVEEESARVEEESAWIEEEIEETEEENAWIEEENAWIEEESAWAEEEGAWQDDEDERDWSWSWHDDESIEDKANELREDLAGTPYAGLDDDELKRLVRYGLDGEDVREYIAAGYDDLSADELASLAKFGLDGDDIREYAESGYSELSVDELIRLAKFGLDGEDIREYAESGHSELSVDELIRLAKFGLDGEDIREYAESGYEGLSIEDLVRLAKFGLDGEDIREYAESGYEGLSLDELVALAKFGLDGDDIREYAESGHEDLSVEELIRLAKFGLDGDDIREYAESGHENLSIDELVALAKFGLDGDDIREYAEAGYEGLSVDDLIRLAKYGVDGDDLRRLKDAGHDLSVDEVIDRARHGELDD